MADIYGRYAERAKEIAIEVAKIAKTTNRRPMFAIETTAGGDERKVFFPPIRFAPNVVSGVAKIYTIEEAKNIARSVDGVVETILVDVEGKIEGLSGVEGAVKEEVTKSEVLTVKINDMTVEAADALIAQLVDKIHDKRVAVIGAGNIGSKLALKLVERGANVVITRRNEEKAKKIAGALNIVKPKSTLGKVTAAADNLKAARGADVLIGLTPKAPVITREIVEAMNPAGLLIDGGIGTIYPEAIELAVQRGIRVLRLDARAGFAGGVTTILETKNLTKNVMGKRSIAGIPVVAGGFIGERGDIIVDSISKPIRVIGVADGSGGVLKNPEPEFKRRMEKVGQEIGGSIG